MTILLTIVCLLGINGCGLTSRSLSSDPGYAKLETPSFWEADKEVSLSLGPTILSFASAFIEDDEEVAGIMKNLKGVNLRVYNVDGNSDLFNEYLSETNDQLNLLGWEQLASVNDEGEKVSILIKFNDDEVSGVVVLVLDEREAVFINLIGNIDPKTIQPIVAGLYDNAPELPVEI